MSSIDIVVPCYNYGRFLRNCVNSVLTQRGVDVRVLIIDDASSDDTSIIATSLAADDSRVTFRHHAVNQGLIRTANEGIFDWAAAPYSLLLSADDALTPGALRRATHLLDTHSDVGMVYGMATIIASDADQSEQEVDMPPTYQILSGGQFIEFSCLHGNPAASPTAVVRTMLQQQTGGYCDAMPHTSDMEMWMRLATLHSVGVIRDVQAYYRLHGQNMVLKYSSSLLRDLDERARTCEHVYKNCSGNNIDGFQTWLMEMKVKFAQEALQAASSALNANDETSYSECTAFASRMDPRAKYSWRMVRLQLKRLLGAQTWHAILRLATLSGAVQNATNSDNHVSDWSQGSRFGWWPDAIDRRNL